MLEQLLLDKNVNNAEIMHDFFSTYNTAWYVIEVWCVEKSTSKGVYYNAIHTAIYLLTYIGVFGLDFVSKLLPDEAAQAHNPYTILIPY